MDIVKLSKILKPFQVEKLLQIVIDFHWAARRYADGRSSYYPSMFNDHVRTLQAMEVPLEETGDKTVFAQDGMGRVYDNLSDYEAKLAKINVAETRFIEDFDYFCKAGSIDIYQLPPSIQHAYHDWLKATGREDTV